MPEVGVAGEPLRIYSYSIYLDIPNDNTPINTRGHKLSGTCFSSTVDLHLTGETTEQYHLLPYQKTTQEKQGFHLRQGTKKIYWLRV